MDQNQTISDLFHEVRNFIDALKGLFKAWQTKNMDAMNVIGKSIERIGELEGKMDRLSEKVPAQSEDLRETALLIAWNHLGGVAYRWGGDDPIEGYDCSGFVIEILQSVGILPLKRDWTAQQLYGHFQDQAVRKPYRGTLAFWANGAGRIFHVELCIDDSLSIGASGGGSSVRTEADAAQKNAFVKIRPIAARYAPQMFYADPFMRTEKEASHEKNSQH